MGKWLKTAWEWFKNAGKRPKTIGKLIDAHRAWVLLGVVAIVIVMVAFFNWLTDSDLFRKFFFPKICDQKFPASCDPLAWKDLFQAAVLILGVPVAFCLWHWRDRNVRDQIETARKDINLKEFQEVQLRAAGALDENLLAEAREQLQIAALHQLRGFLRGEYGKSFQRPAFELLLAGHAAAMERIGLAKAIADWRANNPPADTIRKELREAITTAKQRLTAVERARMAIMADEWEGIFRHGWPLTKRNFDLIDLSDRKLPKGLDLQGSSFCGAHLWGAHLEGASLRWAHLAGADLRGAHLAGANLNWAHLAGANLYEAHLAGANLLMAHLEGANLNWAHLEDADLRGAHLEGADLRGAHLEGANLYGIDPATIRGCKRARYNDHTIFVDPADWRKSVLTAEEVREQWRAKGARHVDEPEAGG